MTRREEHTRIDGQWKELSDWSGDIYESLRNSEHGETGCRDSEVISIGPSQSAYLIFSGIFHNEEIIFQSFK